MKIFLFLYPIKPFIEQEVRNWFWRDEDEDVNPLDRLNDLVEVRYRQRGYQVCWVTFSVHGHPKEIEKRHVSERIIIRECDQLIPAGISFRSHIDKKLKRHPWPSIKHIFGQLPTPIEEVWVGGFHQFSCVNKISRHIYRKGILTRVDEDLTDNYFFAMRHVGIPDIREEFTAEAFGNLNMEEGSSDLIQRNIRFRRKHPWYAQSKGP